MWIFLGWYLLWTGKARISLAHFGTEKTCFFTRHMIIKGKKNKIKLGTATQKFTISTNIQHVPANHTSQAHFHGEVIGAGLIIIYVWQQVFARLHSDRRRAILLFLQTRLFRGVHLTQVNPDLFFQEDRKSTF